ncbi:MAG: ABC transporter ATP-binding protein [Cyclobacteriaceae bacterium]|jgi:putative ABC transport system ATP-binding protein|nr:ABC transporter ATP-binding protein [Cyclobacteriaceae bacterium]
MVEVRSLSYQYPHATSISFPDFSADVGKHYLLLGQSGSGKTTLLHLVGGLLRSQQGSIRVCGTEVASLSEAALDRFRGTNLGFVFQKNHLMAALTVEENLWMAPYLAGKELKKQRAEEVLAQLGLADKRQARIQELSHGQAQRVSIARAVMNKPAVILADEPTSALDDANCEKVTELLLSVAKQNEATLVIATHDQRLKSKITHHLHLK